MLAFVTFYGLYIVVQAPTLRLCVLLIFSLLFHTHFAGAAGVVPIVALTLLTYSFGLSNDRRLCLVGVAVCAASLVCFKYSHFLIDQLLPLSGPQAVEQLHRAATAFLPVTPPLAISFFVFEFIHYLLEVRRGSPVIRNFYDFLHFTFFFPTLVAGPVKRYQTFLPALKAGVSAVSLEDFVLGLMQTLVGAFKKLVLADNMSAFIEWSQNRYHFMTPFERWNFLFILALRIYFDFGGYSDIAIGIARMMGIKVPANFNFPYLAHNVADFWRRWHISLSTWIRDYIYILLGGGRLGLGRKVGNAVLAFLICGLWHGAAWNFILWGLYHGLGLAICTTYRQCPPLGWVGTLMDRAPALAWFSTFLFVCFGWLLLFYPPQRAWSLFALLWSF